MTFGPATKAITPAETKLLKFLRAEIQAHGIAPTFDEISAALGFKSKNHITGLLWNLEMGDFIRRMPRRARGIELLDTEDHCGPDCNCDPCAHRRYMHDLKLVLAIGRPTPPILNSVSLKGFRVPADRKLLGLLGYKAAPRTRKRAIPSGGGL